MNVAALRHTNLKVLVIDDDELMQELFKATFGLLGVYKIEIVSNGRRALDATKNKEAEGDPFNIIVVDWEMPVMDGIGFLESFRKNDKKAVVIMVTARTSSADFSEAKRKGADYFFMKPLDIDMLKLYLGSAIDAVLKSRSD